MNLETLVRKTVESKPPRVVLYGIRGIGKTTWAANAPSSIFLLTEDGLGEIDVPHFPLVKDYDEFCQYLRMLYEEENEFKTIVIDTLDWLETIIWDSIAKKHGVSNVDALGYGKGYLFAMELWMELVKKFNKLRDKGFAIVCLAHSEIKSFSPPDTDPYDRYQIKLHKMAAAKIEEWSDVVLFANYKTYVQKNRKPVNAEQERVMFTTNKPAWFAKNRYSLPEELPMDFSALLNNIKKGKKENG